MEYLLVGIGGMMGSISRYELGKFISSKHKFSFPVGTFIINIIGAIFLGILSSYNNTNNIYILFGDGFLGAFTTFSTFMYEGFNLFRNKKTLNASIYIVLSIILGIIGFFIGSAIY